MKLPSNLQRFTDDIHAKIVEFESKITHDDFVSWILQFSAGDQALATQLFLNIKYFNSEEVTHLCRALFTKLPKHVVDDLEHSIFVGLGPPGDSGDMILYHYRNANELPESLFTDTDGLKDLLKSGRFGHRARHLIFLDDFIGTGGQATELLTRELKEVLARGSFDYVGLHALVGFVDGLALIRNGTRADACVAHELTDKDKVFNEACNILTEDYHERERLRAVIEGYGKRLYPKGSLGYGGTQALVTFFYNTPNNTLPILWARSNNWTPLLPRTESPAAVASSEDEKLVLTYIYSVGGRCRAGDVMGLLPDPTMSLRTLQELRQRHMIEVIDDDVSEYVETTVKGDREALTYFNDDPLQSRVRLCRCGAHFNTLLPSNPRSSVRNLESLRTRKPELLGLIASACVLGDTSTVISLRWTISWLLLMDHEYDERIELGSLILDSFGKEQLGTEWGWIKVDDLGWSSTACGRLELALRHINEGLADLWSRRDIAGVCQGWRHLQGIRSRQGNYTGAALGLRMVYGAACAIADTSDRIEMQAGILRGLANVCTRAGHHDAATKYRNSALTLSRELGDELHASTEVPTVFVGTSSNPNACDLNDASTVVLVRHPVTVKNLKRLFGRHSPATVLEDAKRQIALAVKSMREIVGKEHEVAVYCASSPTALTMAAEVAAEWRGAPLIDESLDSIDSGQLTGISEDDAAEYFPQLVSSITAYRNNELDGYLIEFPDGESVRHLTLRVAKTFIERISQDLPGKVIIVVGHNSSITAALNVLTALDRQPPDAAYRYFDVPLSSATVVRVNGVDEPSIEQFHTT